MRIKPVEVGMRRGDWSRSAVLGSRSSSALDFADLVAEQLVGTVLPWSRRESLVRTAQTLGISRFEANLIIAAVQNQMGVGFQRGETRRPRLTKRIAMGLTVFVAVQAVIVAAAWYWLS
ncbi:MAG: hypothetical protein ABSC42_17445 [Tepidisphaeraceae bacterium]|jgi:hypothetical protein